MSGFWATGMEWPGSGCHETEIAKRPPLPPYRLLVHRPEQGGRRSMREPLWCRWCGQTCVCTSGPA